MQVSEILGIDIDLEATGLCFDCKLCNEGDIFFCLSGDYKKDLERAKTAVNSGAVAIVSQHNFSDMGIPNFVVQDARSEIAWASHRFYGKPSEKLTMVGITGTNGKTTTTYIIKNILEKAGRIVGLVGTNELLYNSKHYPALLTTPDPIDLHRILRDMLDSGIDTVVMEVSAHALALRKLDGIMFSVSAFTNLTTDHLDFFESIDNYKATKMKLFTDKMSRACVINVDDNVGIELNNTIKLPIITYGCKNPSDIFGIDYKASVCGCKFVANVLDEIMDIHYCATGRYNMLNVLCALGVTRMLGISFDEMRDGIESAKNVKGRINFYTGNGKTVVVDYAHTPDGLKNIINTVREVTTGRVITVFGCGGQRDREKRHTMGEIASTLSDFTIITSDNPRNEVPMAIIADIVSGVKSVNYMVEEDRYIAIQTAIDMCETDDAVIIAGKGHESTQEIANKKIVFSDIETVKDMLK